MAISKIKAEFPCKAEEVWNMVTSLEHYSWRSDISEIVVLIPEKQFEEYTKEGYVTRFTITEFKPYERYEFDMDNPNMSGHWTGVFTAQENTVSIAFTEEVTAKKRIMKPFVKAYLKKQQLRYISDLKKALEEMGGTAAQSQKN